MRINIVNFKACNNLIKTSLSEFIYFFTLNLKNASFVFGSDEFRVLRVYRQLGCNIERYVCLFQTIWTLNEIQKTVLILSFD